jgi:hypothetical protein
MRRAEWFHELLGVLVKHARTPFSYGRFDCCTFAAECIDAMTGSRHTRRMSTTYQDQASLSRFMNGRDLIWAVSQFLGAPGGRPRTGDCVVFRTKSEPQTCGIVFGPLIVVAGKNGFGLHARTGILARWAI